MKRYIYIFIGTTAEYIKMAPIIRELNRRKIPFKLITTGQVHINLQEFEEFTGKVKRYMSFKEKKNKASMLFFIFWAFQTLLSSIIILRNEFKKSHKTNTYFIVHGDTVSSTIGAIVAKIYGLKLVHVEAGYFSFNMLEPFPEEICRMINTHLADVMFSPTDWAKGNLASRKNPVFSTKENTMIETFKWALKQKIHSKYLSSLKKYYILILHRQEHVLFRKEWSKKILASVIKNAPKNMDCILISYPITVKIIESLGLHSPRIKTLPQIPYVEFIHLMNNSEFIASDGATNQQEAHFMGKPLLALREFTEQTEGIGENVILSKSSTHLIKNFIKYYKKYKTSPIDFPHKPAKQIVDYLLTH